MHRPLLFLTLTQAALAANTITVTTTADSWVVDRRCSLREAVQAANIGASFQGCAYNDVGAASDHIILKAKTYQLYVGGQEDQNLGGDLDLLPTPRDVSVLGVPGAVLEVMARVERAFHQHDARRRFEIHDLILRAGNTRPPLGGLILAEGGSVDLRAVELHDGEAGDGGALFAWPGVPINWSEGVCSNSSADRGGCIVGFSTLVVADVEFDRNSADTEGGAIWNSGPVTLDGCHFTENEASADGGAVLARTTLDARHSDFLENEAWDEGGALYVGGALQTVGCLFQHNTAGYDGGAAWAETAVVMESEFEGNEALLRDGGALFAGGGYLLEVRLYANTAARNGGAVATTGAFRLIEVDARRNTARASGGALFVPASVHVLLSRFEANSAPLGGAIHCAGEDILTSEDVSGSHIEESTFLSNVADEAGGALRFVGAALFVRDCQGRDNRAPLGGFAQLESGETSIERAVLHENRAEVGGAVYIGTLGSVNPGVFVDAALRTENTTLSSNQASTQAGHAVHIGPRSAAKLALSTVAENGRRIGVGSAVANHGRLWLLGVVLDNRPPNCGGNAALVMSQYNVEDADTCGLSGSSNLVNTPPLLGALQDNGGATLTHALAPFSPAVDYFPSCGVSEDQRQAPRPEGPACDAGAYESRYGATGEPVF